MSLQVQYSPLLNIRKREDQDQEVEDTKSSMISVQGSKSFVLRPCKNIFAHLQLF